MNQITWLEDVPDAERWGVYETPFDIDDIEYLATMKHRSTTTRLCVKKPPALVERTVDLLAGFQNANIVELGISQGGSAAMIAQVARPRKLVALELDDEPVEELENFVKRAGLAERVRPYYGVDQSDRDQVRTIIDKEFAGEPIDLVLDDASHLLDATRESFDVLFPRLRPGGLFILEDWNWEHVKAKNLHDQVVKPGSDLRSGFAERFREAMSDPNSREHLAFKEWLEDLASNKSSQPRMLARPLTILVIELLLARAWSSDAISELLVQELWVRVTRGPEPIDPNTFRLADIVNDRFGLLPRHAR